MSVMFPFPSNEYEPKEANLNAIEEVQEDQSRSNTWFRENSFQRSDTGVRRKPGGRRTRSDFRGATQGSVKQSVGAGLGNPEIEGTDQVFTFKWSMTVEAVDRWSTVNLHQ
ncbi:hypothetical protein L1887_19143 [Cichorium endivia]|nr:hypothetical protein L1887_19143 [Cichorium endivia]